MSTDNILTGLKVELVPIGLLKPYPNNARIHSKAQIKLIAESIETFGFNNPILTDKDYGIIAGHGRLEAAKLLGMTTVPTICLDHLTPAQKRAYILMDNRSAEKSKWHDGILTIELEEIRLAEPEFKITSTGFTMPEIDILVQKAKNQDPDAGDNLPEVLPIPVTRLGDLWQLGLHRIYCGDSLLEASYQAVMQGEVANIVVSDPPFNVKIKGHVSGLGKAQHEEFAMASGEMSQAEFTNFLKTAFENFQRHSLDGSLHYLFADWRHSVEYQTAAGNVYSEQKNLAIWVKQNGGMGAMYRSQHELIYIYKAGTAPHINNVSLGKNGRYRTNCWHYAGANSFHRGRDKMLEMHPTVKPVRMLSDILLDASHQDGLVLDGFGGSGSTLIAAEKTGRKARLIELDPKYVDVTIRRWEALTGQDAINIATQQTFKQAHQEVGDEQL